VPLPALLPILCEPESSKDDVAAREGDEDGATASPAAATMAGAPSRLGHRHLTSKLQGIAPLPALLPLLRGSESSTANVAARDRDDDDSATASTQALACALTECLATCRPRRCHAWGKEKLSGETSTQPNSQRSTQPNTQRIRREQIGMR
jgi:hypothetical protein